jgi:hypothetical protein
LALSVSLSLQAGKIRLREGSLDALKDVSKMNIQFDYAQMRVGEFASEEEFIRSKSAALEARARGRGRSWERAWISDRWTYYEPKFKEVFSAYSGFAVGKLPEAAYTLIIRTTFLEPGFNAYVVRKNARIDVVALVVETASPSRVVAMLTVKKAVGPKLVGDYSSGVRLQQAYAAAARGLALSMRKYMDR